MTVHFSFVARTFIAAVASALLLATAAQAHESHGKPQHGGVVAEAALFQAELVLKQNLVTIYLSDHGKALSAKDVKGKLTVLADGKTHSLDLAPNATNSQLQTTLPAPIKAGKFVAQITLPNKPATSLRFEVK